MSLLNTVTTQNTEDTTPATSTTEQTPTTKRTRAEINRENAQKSTGPRTPEGKARVRFNATRHHLTGQIVLLPEGDFAAYTDVLDRFTRNFAPVGEAESILVGQMANATWRLNHSHAYEMCLLALDHNPGVSSETNPPQVTEALATAAAIKDNSRTMANLSLYRSRDYRILEKSMAKLEALQTARKAQEKAALEEAGRLLRLHQAEQEMEERKANKNGAPMIPRPYLPPRMALIFQLPKSPPLSTASTEALKPSAMN